MSTKIKHTTQISPDHVEHGIANNVTDTDESSGAYVEADLDNGSLWYNVTGDKLKAKIDGTTRVLGEDIHANLEPITDATYNTGESIGVANALKLIYLTHLRMKPVVNNANFTGDGPVVFTTTYSASPIATADVGSIAIGSSPVISAANIYFMRHNGWRKITTS